MSASTFSPHSSLRITYPQQDVDRLFVQIRRATKELGLSVPHALNTAMKAVLTSMAKATRVSSRYRDFKEVGVSRRGMNKKYAVTTRYSTPKGKGAATRASWRGPWREQIIYARNEQELKRRPAVVIAMHGLAAESWRQAGKKGRFNLTKAQRKTRMTAHNARIVKRAARNWVTYNSHKNPNDPYVMVRNRLPYIESAIEGGNSTVTQAMGNAATAMELNVSKQLERRLGK